MYNTTLKLGRVVCLKFFVDDCRAGTTYWGVWGCNTPPPPPQRNVKKGGPNFPRGGLGMLELRNVLNIEV
jgi:hypothetical protein